MITAIDMIGTSLASGTKSYNLYFSKHLKNKNLNDKIYIITCLDYSKLIDFKNKNIKVLIKSNILKNSLIKFLWMQFILPFELKFLNVKQFYSPMNYGPLTLKLFNIRFILALHSNLPWVYFFMMPGNILRNLLTKYFMQLSILFCDKLIVDSYYAKKEIQNYISIEDDKIDVVYLGINDEDEVSNSELKSVFLNNKNYFLSVLSCVKYHNIINLLKAYQILIDKFDHKINYILVMQVLDKSYFNEIKKFIDKNFKKNEIIIYSNLDYKYLKELYKNSKFYLFSSYCEVFGLTSLEAMANNCPVLTSDRSALKEINLDAAKYFDPDNIEEIAEMMNELLKNKPLNKELKEKGLKHSKKFSWDKTVDHTLKILDLEFE